MTTTISYLVNIREIPALKQAMAGSGGRYIQNPRRIKGTKAFAVEIGFDNPSSSHKFYCIFNNLTKKVVEVDKRKWYTKYLNRITLFMKRFKKNSSRT